MTDRFPIISWLMVLFTLKTVIGTDGLRIKRIAGGSDAGPQEFPYQVSLRFYSIHICGGALISERHVLSAAHCMCELIDEPYEELTVVTGSTNIRTGGQRHVVESVQCHPHYVFGVDDSWEHDLAVIRLTKNVILSPYQSPISLPTCDTAANVRAVITGWGRSDPRSILHENLQKLSVHTLENTDCQTYYNNTILPSQICTLEKKGLGACKGDSGSPLVQDGVLIGIFSWTKPCAIGSPDVFTRIYSHLIFVKEAMEDDNNNV
ncbi:hypothetical protein KM043_004286 [Ampulex compressa]|nr:hypothetical protein KM043_004286 [Ampulex compressa]